MTVESVTASLRSLVVLLDSIWDFLLLHVPFLPFVDKYIKNSYQHDPFRILLELLLLIFAAKYALSSRKAGIPVIKLTNKEIEGLIEEWTPEPLTTALVEEKDDRDYIHGSITTTVDMGNGEVLLNLASANFAGLSGNKEVEEKAIKALRKYGVGACGPPGFYGTMDAHVELEANISKFMNTEDAIIYSQAYTTVASALPAFAKRGDILVVDEGCNFATQKAVQISRAHIFFYKHNDMESLEEVLIAVQRDFAKKPLTRRFIVSEGIFANFGDIADLPTLVRLKKRFKYRLVLEESMSVGAIGARGAGCTDFFNIPASDVDVLCASMSNSLAATGGFCAASKEIIDHQRLSGLGYCFSAATPPMLAVAASGSIAYLTEYGFPFKEMQRNIKIIRKALKDLPGYHMSSHTHADISPVIHIWVDNDEMTRKAKDDKLGRIVKEVRKKGVYIVKSKYIDSQEQFLPEPSIKLSVCAGLTVKNMEKCAEVLQSCLKESC